MTRRRRRSSRRARRAPCRGARPRARWCATPTAASTRSRTAARTRWCALDAAALAGCILECPVHGGRLDVRDGSPQRHPIRRPCAHLSRCARAARRSRSAPSPDPTGRTTMHDLVIRGGTIVDGTGSGAARGRRRDRRAAASPRSAATSGAGARDARRARQARDARLRRHPHPLRRPGHLGPAAHAVVLARRHDGRDGQLRRRLRAGAPGRRAVPDRPDGGRRGHPGHRARRGHALGLGELPRVPRRARADPARARHRHAGAARRGARLRDGRARREERAGDAATTSRAWPRSCARASRPARSASRRRARSCTARSTASRCRARSRPRTSCSASAACSASSAAACSSWRPPA